MHLMKVRCLPEPRGESRLRFTSAEELARALPVNEVARHNGVRP